MAQKVTCLHTLLRNMNSNPTITWGKKFTWLITFDAQPVHASEKVDPIRGGSLIGAFHTERINCWQGCHVTLKNIKRLENPQLSWNNNNNNKHRWWFFDSILAKFMISRFEKNGITLALMFNGDFFLLSVLRKVQSWAKVNLKCSNTFVFLHFTFVTKTSREKKALMTSEQ